jgi:hypothetical protein
VVVIVQPRVLECLRVRCGEHAQGAAGLQAQRLDFRYQGGNAFDVAVLGRAPCGAHAETCGASLLRSDGRGAHCLHIHQFACLHAGVVVHRLRTIGAVFTATAGFDRQQRRQFKLAGIKVLTMNYLRAVQQIGKRQIEKRQNGTQRSARLGYRLCICICICQ